MPKVLVTGSTGLVGSACEEVFKKKGWEVVGIDNGMRSYFFGVPERRAQYHIDIRDEKNINNLFEKVHFDAIIHAAAQPSHDWAVQEPLTDFDVNARGTLVLLEATRRYCPDATFVYVSTDKVYGDRMSVMGVNEWPNRWGIVELLERETRYEITNRVQSPFRGFQEELGLDFGGQRSLFGCSKTAADLYVQEYGNYFGMKTACFRPGCITGSAHAGAEQHGFLSYLARCIKEERVYTVYGFKGKQVRDQIHANDLASVFYEFIEDPKVAAVYNMGGGPERSISVLEAIPELEKRLGKKAHIAFGEERKGDRVWDVHNIYKFRTDYPYWDYQYSLSDILDELCLTK